MPQKGACDACRRRKVQCYGLPPPCTRCEHKAIPCTFEHFNRSRSRSRIASKAHASQTFSHRIERIERALSNLPIIEEQAVTPRVTPPVPGQASRARIHFAGHFVGHIGSFTGVPFISATGRAWIEERTGQKESLDTICSIGPDWQASLDQTQNLLQQAVEIQSSAKEPELPPRRTVEHFFALYCSTGFSQVFAIFEPVLFKMALDTAYGDKSPGTDAAKCFVIAFMLLASEWQHEWNTGFEVDEKDYEGKALLLVTRVIGEPDVTSTQIFLILAIRYLFHGQEEHALIYHAMACRHLFSLGAHVQPAHRSQQTLGGEERISHLKSMHLRRLFWVAYWSDGDISLRTGRPPSIDDDYCDLSLPADHHIFEAGESNSEDNLNPTTSPMGFGLGAADLQLAMIKSRVGKSLFSASALRKTDAEILRIVRELDDELECWRMSVPPCDRPTLGMEHDDQPLEDPSLSAHLRLRRIGLQLHYLYLVAIIHQASSRCRRWSQAEEADQLSGISSSIAISLHASRASLREVRMTVDSIGGMRGNLFYPVSAALNMFCIILLDPLSPSTAEDIASIGSVSELIKNLTEQWSPGKGRPAWVSYLNTFIAELARLAQCAVNKAQEQSVGGIIVPV